MTMVWLVLNWTYITQLLYLGLENIVGEGTERLKSEDQDDYAIILCRQFRDVSIMNLKRNGSLYKTYKDHTNRHANMDREKIHKAPRLSEELQGMNDCCKRKNQSVVVVVSLFMIFRYEIPTLTREINLKYMQIRTALIGLRYCVCYILHPNST